MDLSNASASYAAKQLKTIETHIEDGNELAKPYRDKIADYDKSIKSGQKGTNAAILMGALESSFTILSFLTQSQVSKLGKEKEEINKTLSPIENQLSALRKYKEQLESAMKSSATEKNAIIQRLSFRPLIWSHRIDHANAIYDELNRYGERFRVDPDDIITAMRSISPDTADAFMNILRADYRKHDLETITAFAQNHQAFDHPAMLAFFQFTNHAVFPHQDFFEIWTSKMHDLEAATDEIDRLVTKGSTLSPSEAVAKLPALEILGNKAITLSGERSVETLPTNDKAQAAIKAAAQADAQKNEAIGKIHSIIHHLHATNGTFKQRHEEAIEKASEAIASFSTFYDGIRSAIIDVEQQLAALEAKHQRAATEWDKTEAFSTTRKLAEMESAKHQLIASLLPSAAGAATAMMGGRAENAIVHAASAGVATSNYSLAKKKLELQVNSLQQRATLYGNPKELKTLLDKLGEDIINLEEDKKFQEFLANEPAVEEARQAYMLLPRLRAGEANIDPLQMRIERSPHYETIDEFLDDLRKQRGARLYEGMRNFLIGLADSNDLNVIIAEANSIESPETEAEKIFFRYAESSIKEHFREHAKQASIVDVLKMRNVLFTGSPLHSFGEVVKMETDAALQSLFAGEGEFNLIGSNDVHQIFGFYMTRHGEEGLRDLHNPSSMVAKVAQKADATGLRKARNEIIERRHANTNIPQPGTIFTEICAYEYFLPQGKNFLKENDLKAHPQTVESYRMVNATVHDFLNKLAFDKTRKQNPELLTPEIESLIAQSFIDFFSELGAEHAKDVQIQTKSHRVAEAYFGGNYSLTSTTYGDLITEDAQDSFGLFLKVYKHNLEKYLEVAPRDKQEAMLEQLDAIKDMMAHLKPEKIRLPNSDETRKQAHLGNNTLSYVGVNPQTWADRAIAIHNAKTRRL